MSAIVDIVGREILDSRGNPTVECDVLLESGVLGRGTVLADGSAAEVMAVDDPWIKSYFASRHTVQSASSPGRQAPRDGA